VELRLKQERLFDEDIYTVHPEDYRALCEKLKADGFDFPRAVSGIDTGYGLRVTLHLTRLHDRAKVTVRTDVRYENPVVASVTDLWPGVEWYEREAYDMLGVRFSGHPDLRRILLEDEWELHPLLKRYDTGGYPIPGWEPKAWPDPDPWTPPPPPEPEAGEAGEGGEAS